MLFKKNISLEAFCIRCKKKTGISNPRLETTLNGKSIIKGNCSVCQTNVASITSPSTSQADLEKAVEKEKKEKILKEEEKEKEGVNEFIQKSKENDILKRNGIKIVKRNNYYNLIKFGLFLLTVIVIIFFYRTYYSSEFIPKFNNTNICGNCECPQPSECPICPGCPNCSVICGACNIPNELEIDLNIINGTE